MPKGHKTIPRREFGSSIGTKTLPATLPLVGLGCSSFSQFFWSSTECSEEPAENWTPGSMRKDHPRVQQWMKTIHFAVEECGINLLDTAPWLVISIMVVTSDISASSFSPLSPLTGTDTGLLKL